MAKTTYGSVALFADAVTTCALSSCSVQVEPELRDLVSAMFSRRIASVYGKLPTTVRDGVKTSGFAHSERIQWSGIFTDNPDKRKGNLNQTETMLAGVIRQYGPLAELNIVCALFKGAVPMKPDVDRFIEQVIVPKAQETLKESQSVPASP